MTSPAIGGSESFRGNVDAYWPHQRSPSYTAVEVLLVSWKEHDFEKSRLEREINYLCKVFEHVFIYKVWEYQIPTDSSTHCLERRIKKFLHGIESNSTQPTELSIFYYIGHGGVECDLGDRSGLRWYR